MTFSVIYAPDAEQTLAAVWLSSPDRNSVTRAAHKIDSLLQHDPMKAGGIWAGARRVLVISPLGVIYQVYPQQRLVRVLFVFPFGTNSIP